jgi:hypothetical protein
VCSHAFLNVLNGAGNANSCRGEFEISVEVSNSKKFAKNGVSLSKRSGAGSSMWFKLRVAVVMRLSEILTKTSKLNKFRF